MMKKASKWAKKKLVVDTPNGFWLQGEADGNERQKHLSAWNISDYKKLGFKIRGLAGFKFLRKPSEGLSVDDGLLSSIRFQPKILFFIIATLSQSFTYRFPQFAFNLFAVKKLDK